MAEFDAKLIEGARGGAFVEVPDAAVEELGGGGRIKITATFDGEPYRGSIVTMGGRRILGVVKAIRAAIGKAPGDTIRVAVERDTAERVVEVPPELAAALAAHPDAAAAYGAMSYTCRREYAQWIAEARRNDTKDRRAAKAVAMILHGDKL